MADSFPKLLRGFIILTLFSFLVVGFAIQLASNYNKDTGDLANKTGYAMMQSSLYSINQSMGGYKESFASQNVFLALGGIVLTGIFQLLAVGTGMLSVITMPFTILSGLLVILGVPQVVIMIIYTMIILTIIFGIWKVVKSGIF